MNRSQRVYRALLHAYPARTRTTSGDDMVQLFADRLRDATTRGEQAVVWAEAIVDIARTAPREHLARRGQAAATELGPIFYTPTRNDVAVTLVPIAIAAAIVIVRPAYFAPMLDPSVNVAGMPLGVAGLGFSAFLAAVGLFLARRTDLGDPQVQYEAILWGLLPAALLLLVAPLSTVAAYAIAMVGFVLVARYRIVMLTLVVPFVVWLLTGPAIVLVLAAMHEAD